MRISPNVWNLGDTQLLVTSCLLFPPPHPAATAVTISQLTWTFSPPHLDRNHDLYHTTWSLIQIVIGILYATRHQSPGQKQLIMKGHLLMLITEKSRDRQPDRILSAGLWLYPRDFPLALHGSVHRPPSRAGPHHDSKIYPSSSSFHIFMLPWP